MKKQLMSNKVLLGLLFFCGLMLLMPSGAYALEKMEDACRKFAENEAEYSGGKCWTCDIFMLFFDAANEVAGQINTVMSGPATKALLVFGSLWLVFNLVVFFSSVADAPDLMGFLTKVGGMSLKIGVAAVFLAGGAGFVFDYFINPVLISASLLGIDILKSTSSSVNCTLSGGAATLNAPMSPDVRQAMDCFIRAIADGMAKSQAIAEAMRCGARFWLPIEAMGISFNIPNPLMWLIGAFLGCLFWLISCLFPITMLDVIFRIGLMVGMLPLFVVAWVFPVTKGYAKKGWDIFFHSSMVFTIASLIVAMVVKMVEEAWGFTTSQASSRAGDFSEAMDLFASSAYVEAFDLLFASALGDLCVVMMIAFWGLIIAPQTDKLSGAFVGADEFPESCGMKALKATIGFIIDAIMLVITILTFGATIFLWVAKVAKFLANTKKAIEKARKMMEAAKKMRKRAAKIRETAKKVKSKVNKGRQIAGV